MSLKAHLYYGFPLWQTEEEDPEGLKLDWLQEELFEEEATAAIHKPDHTDYQQPEWKQYFQEKNALIAALPCEVVIVGHHNDPYYALTIRGVGFAKFSYDDTAIVLPPLNPQWDVWLKQWCDKYEFTYRDPSWHLAPYYF